MAGEGFDFHPVFAPGGTLAVAGLGVGVALAVGVVDARLALVYPEEADRPEDAEKKLAEELKLDEDAVLP